MKIEQTGSRSLRIHAPAKINLFLEIIGKRPDGYHELETVMHSVDLYDLLDIRLKGGATVLHTTGRDAGPPEENLALKAARAFEDRSGERMGFEIRLEKRIPVGGGLGGGSSDCAAVLLGCNELAGKPFTREELQSMAAELGSDVPFFLTCGTARCTGRGEVVSPIPGVPALAFLILYPGFSLSTRKVYENLNLDLTKLKTSHTLITELKGLGEAEAINPCLFNRLEQPAFQAFPALYAVWENARNHGLNHIRITGSGSSLFQVVSEKEIGEGKTEFLNIDHRWDLFLVKSSPEIQL